MMGWEQEINSEWSAVHYISQLHKTTHFSCLIYGRKVTFNSVDNKIYDKNCKLSQERVRRKHGKEKEKSRHRNRLRFLKKVEEFFLDWKIKKNLFGQCAKNRVLQWPLPWRTSQRETGDFNWSYNWGSPGLLATMMGEIVCKSFLNWSHGWVIIKSDILLLNSVIITMLMQCYSDAMSDW